MLSGLAKSFRGICLLAAWALAAPNALAMELTRPAVRDLASQLLVTLNIDAKGFSTTVRDPLIDRLAANEELIQHWRVALEDSPTLDPAGMQEFLAADIHSQAHGVNVVRDEIRAQLKLPSKDASHLDDFMKAFYGIDETGAIHMQPASIRYNEGALPLDEDLALVKKYRSRVTRDLLEGGLSGKPIPKTADGKTWVLQEIVEARVNGPRAFNDTLTGWLKNAQRSDATGASYRRLLSEFVEEGVLKSNAAYRDYALRVLTHPWEAKAGQEFFRGATKGVFFQAARISGVPPDEFLVTTLRKFPPEIGARLAIPDHLFESAVDVEAFEEFVLKKKNSGSWQKRIKDSYFEFLFQNRSEAQIVNLDRALRTAKNLGFTEAELAKGAARKFFEKKFNWLMREGGKPHARFNLHGMGPETMEFLERIQGPRFKARMRGKFLEHYLRDIRTLEFDGPAQRYLTRVALEAKTGKTLPIPQSVLEELEKRILSEKFLTLSSESQDVLLALLPGKAQAARIVKAAQVINASRPEIFESFFSFDSINQRAEFLRRMESDPTFRRSFKDFIAWVGEEPARVATHGHALSDILNTYDVRRIIPSATERNVLLTRLLVNSGGESAFEIRDAAAAQLNQKERLLFPSVDGGTLKFTRRIVPQAAGDLPPELQEKLARFMAENPSALQDKTYREWANSVLRSWNRTETGKQFRAKFFRRVWEQWRLGAEQSADVTRIWSEFFGQNSLSAAEAEVVVAMSRSARHPKSFSFETEIRALRISGQTPHYRTYEARLRADLLELARRPYSATYLHQQLTPHYELLKTTLRNRPADAEIVARLENELRSWVVDQAKQGRIQDQKYLDWLHSEFTNAHLAASDLCSIASFSRRLLR